MGEKENKDLVVRFNEEVFNNHNEAVMDELIADDAVEHDPLPGLSNDKAGALETIRQILAGFPDMKADVQQLIASGDKVCVRATFSGTHDGEFMGIPATGKSVEVGSIDIVRVENGKFVEHWGIFDAAGMMMQLGVIQPPPSPG